MDKTFHLISGLPRSGSTLLSSILKQNPRFHASISDPLATLVRGVADNCQSGPGIRYEVSIERRKNLVRGLFDSYYQDVDKPVIFNTNRMWTLILPLVRDLYPQTRTILCVRDIPWVLDSFEKAHRRHPFSKNTIFGDNTGTVYSRMESLMKDDGIVGTAYTGVKQAITSDEKHMVMLIEYDLLCENPEGMLRAIYNFIGEDYFGHDFNNVEASWDEYDSEIGISDLHKIRKTVKKIPRETILPPDLIQRYSNMEVWRLMR